MAKGVTTDKVARQVVMFSNIIFFILGVIMLSLSLVGYYKTLHMSHVTDVMNSLNLGLLTIIIIVAAAATVLTSFLGFLGAYFQENLVLKLYIVLVLITFITQIVIGTFLLDLNMSGLRTAWEQDDATGANRRVTLQNYFGCCGFDTWSDSLGTTIHTDCPEVPATYYVGWQPPESCLQASDNFVHSFITPIATAAIVIGCIESLAMVTACYIVLKHKDVEEDSAFSF